MRFNALWWWIDRWRKSTAYADMTLEEQGAYRNLLDAAALRGGPLPNDERALAKASGDALKWKKVRPKVLAHFTLTPDGWRNDTLDQVLKESQRRAESQKAYRERLSARNGKSNPHANTSSNTKRNATANAADNGSRNKAAYPYPDLSVRTPLTPLKGGAAPVRITRKDLKEAEQVRNRSWGGCRHDPPCPDTAACIAKLARAIVEKRKAAQMSV